LTNIGERGKEAKTGYLTKQLNKLRSRKGWKRGGGPHTDTIGITIIIGHHNKHTQQKKDKQAS